MLLRIFTEPQEGASYSDQLAIARKTQQCGFDGFFRSDHYLAEGAGDGLPGPTDAWVTLAGLARETSRIRLGTLVSSATFRHPGSLAITVAQVDEMSGGRVEFGLGAGWYEAEHRAYGLDFPQTRVRFARLAEQLELITGLWRTPVGQRFHHSGEHYTIVDSPALPKPLQTPHPPLIIGGSGKRRTPALAAQYAAEFNADFTSVEETAQLFTRARAACTAIGRDPETLTLSVVHATAVGRTGTEVRRRAGARSQDAAWVEANGLAGTPAEVVDKLGRYAEIGASRAYLQIMAMNDLDHLDLIAGTVLPQLTGK